jgi:HSP20 family protein
MQRLQYWNPMHEIADTQRRLAAFFGDPVRQELRPQNGDVSWTPAVDISETADAYRFTVELPGIDPQGVEIEVINDILTIKGERAKVERKEGERSHHSERPSGRFARVFHMPKPVNADGVHAAYRDGILSVEVPLRADAKPRRIPVQ